MAADNKTAPVALDAWVDAILLAARSLGVRASPELVRGSSVWSKKFSRREDAILDIAMSAGLIGKFEAKPLKDFTNDMLPALVPVSNEYVGVITMIDNGQVTFKVSAEGHVFERTLSLNELDGVLQAPILTVREKEQVRDKRVDEYLTENSKSWLMSIFTQNWTILFELCAGSLVGNLLAVATSLFAMQVWDRVVPSRSTNTLWVLASGVFIALLIEFGIRTARILITDHFGKQADLKLSSMFFARMMDIKNDARPRSPGSLISQLRDLEQMRELLTSTTLGVCIDLPFVFAFLFIIWAIGGPIAIVPLIAVPLLIIPGLLIQMPLKKLSNQGMQEAALRNAILMESIYRVEDIKMLQAEPRFRNMWHHVNKVSADISMKQRFLGGLLMNFSSTVQQLAYIFVVIYGVYLILDNQLSFGAVMACSILTSRTIAPLAQIPAMFSRLQNAVVGKKGLDGLLTLPLDHPGDKDAYHKPDLKGDYQFQNVVYSYDPMSKPALVVPQFKVTKGERIALLGRVGSGKTTLLRLLGGLSTPQQGRIIFNGTNMGLIDVADIRRDVGFLLQDSSLFYGTLRDNMLMADPTASDEEVLQAMRLSCADQLLLNQPHGLDLVLRENGVGLSGGQKQSLMLARMILRSPNIVLLDEPTASLDEATEQTVIGNLRDWLGDKTMIVATHRYPVLNLVDRILVLDGGRILLDGPKDEILARLSQGRATPEQQAALAAKAQPRVVQGTVKKEKSDVPEGSEA